MGAGRRPDRPQLRPRRRHRTPRTRARRHRSGDPDPAASAGRARALLSPVLPRPPGRGGRPRWTPSPHPTPPSSSSAAPNTPDHPSWTGDRPARPRRLPPVSPISTMWRSPSPGTTSTRRRCSPVPSWGCGRTNPWSWPIRPGLLRSQGGVQRRRLGAPRAQPGPGPPGFGSFRLTVRQHIALHSRDILRQPHTDCGNSAHPCCPSPTTTTTTSKHAMSSTRAPSHPARTRPALRPGRQRHVPAYRTRPPSAGSSSRSSSGSTATRAMARPTPPCAWPRSTPVRP
ncbi:3-dehydroshikimate dehydratase OS=Streptomyces antimycoticus OX=68175 GN=SSPO_039960 PE=3 SV=1 [Streptomyces antimycoticus]